jgi:Holliday junction resolvasome RuvABC endonuclease subunit
MPDGSAMNRGSALALDLGTSTGWALASTDGPIVSGVESFKPGRFEDGGMRFLRFKRWLDELKGNGELGALYFEEVRSHAGVDAAHVYGGFLGVLTTWCEAHAVPYAGVPVGTIKKHATGKGNADKAAMIAAAKACGFDPADDNEADALLLLDFALKHGAPLARVA